MDPFVHVEDGETLLDIIQARLPKAANMYNLAKMYKRFKDVMKMYTIFGDKTEDCWIVTTYIRSDYGLDINISTKNDTVEWTERIEEAFLNTKAIDWTKPYCFASVERKIALKLLQFNIRRIGNAVKVYPCIFYSMDQEEAKKLTINKIPNQNQEVEVEVRPLEGKEGVDFIVETFAYSEEGTKEIAEKIIERNESSAIYLPQIMGIKPVSGIIMATNGLMGMLYTLKEYRNQGYALLCTKQLMKTLGEHGFIPCSNVEIQNEISKSFHQNGLGLKPSHDVDYIIYYGNRKQ